MRTRANHYCVRIARLAVLLGIPAALLTGCSSTGGVIMLNPGVVPGPPVFYGSVRVFASRDIGREVVELGSVSIAANAEVSGGELVSRLQREAAALGADAIVGFEQFGTTVTGVAVRYLRKGGPPSSSRPPGSTP